MDAFVERVRRVQQVLAQESLLPALLASSLAVLLLFGRFYRGGTPDFSFLLWNLFLAWIPYLSSLWAARLHRSNPQRWWYLVAPGVLWLAFFPNAPYIMTDLPYLRPRPPIPLWYDTGMLLAFVLAGLFLGVFSLYAMQKLVRYHVGSLVSWLFVLGALALGGLGVYLGRFLRWNSWDLVLNPQGVLGDVAVRVRDPLAHPQTLGVTLLYAALLLVCYVALTWRDASRSQGQ
jgi:uncharacterized membrane protein